MKSNNQKIRIFIDFLFVFFFFSGQHSNVFEISRLIIVLIHSLRFLSGFVVPLRRRWAQLTHSYPRGFSFKFTQLISNEVNDIWNKYIYAAMETSEIRWDDLQQHLHLYWQHQWEFLICLPSKMCLYLLTFSSALEFN